MPKVPILEPSVGYGTATTPAPEILRPPQGAFGGDVAEATSRLGGAVARTGEEAFKQSLELQMRQDEQQTLDTHTAAIHDLQTKLINPEPDKNGIPKGFLNRNLNQAKGSTEQFDKVSAQMKQQYIDAVPGKLQKERMNELLSSSLTGARESVVQHEAQQGVLAFQDSAKANMEMMVSSAATLTDGKSVSALIEATKKSAMPAYIHMGYGEAQIHEANEALGEKVIKSAITAQLEADPAKAQEIFDSTKHLMSPLAAAELQNKISEKKTFQVAENLTAWAKQNARGGDGYINPAPIEDRLKAMNLNPKQEYEAMQAIRRNIWIDNTEVQKTHDANMRQATLDTLDNKMSLSEAERLFRNGQLSKADFKVLETKLKSNPPIFASTPSYLASNPETFNEIRQAQLTGSKSPGEINRMILAGTGDKGITQIDAKYLQSLNKELPPTPRDKYIEAQANSLRDFGSRYFVEKNFLGMETNKEKTSKEAHGLVSNFYNEVDKAQAQGEDIDKIRDRALKAALQSRFPGVGNLDKMPDAVIDIKGNVIRLLNPDQHSGLKPRYRIVRSSTNEKED